MAQIDAGFSKQITNLLTATPEELKGAQLEKGKDHTTYLVKLPLDGFDVTYSITSLGNVLQAGYLKKGTEDLMENIRLSFLETRYTCKDSKDYPEMLKGMMNSNLNRKLELLSVDLAKGTTQKLLIVTLDKEGKLSINFLNQ